MSGGEHPPLPAMLGVSGRRGVGWLALMYVTIALLMQRGVAAADEPWTATIAFGLIAVAATVLVVPPNDPLPLPCAWVVVVVGPAATHLVNLDSAATNHTIWTSLAYQILLAVLAVRGHIVLAWVGVAAIAAVAAAHAAGGHVDAAVVTTWITPIGLVAALSIFAVIMRPTQRSLAALRRQETLAAAAQAALASQTAERDRQLGRLDAVARPLLERIATGEMLSTADKLECRLLEAALRDGLRAPALVAPELAAAAWRARTRGVEVILLDDGGLDAAPEAVAAVIATAAAELDAATDGTVTVRALPPGRPAVATIVVSTDDDYHRVEIDPGGNQPAAV